MVDCKMKRLQGMSIAEMLCMVDILLNKNGKTRGVPILSLVSNELKKLAEIEDIIKRKNERI